MFVVAAYDVAEPKRLQRVARVLKGFGARVQRSVFECRLEEDDLRRLIEALRPIVKRSEDRVRIYVFCRKCSGTAPEEQFGILEEPGVLFL